MKIKNLVVLAGVVGAVLMLWKNWDEIKNMFGSWGVGPGAPVRPPDTPWFVPPSVTPYLPPSGVDPSTLPDIMPIPPPSLPELIFPPLAFLPHDPPTVPVMPTPPPAPSIPELIFPPLAIIRPIIPPKPRARPMPMPPPREVHLPTPPTRGRDGRPHHFMEF